MLPEFNDDCELCDEGPDDEMAEFRTADRSGAISIVAHAQCGFDRGLELA
jgi:hypothetical protein